VAGGGPAGGVACGQAQEEAFGAVCLPAAGARTGLGVVLPGLGLLTGLGFAFGRIVPTRTARAGIVAG
jgi:hypothetical protein